MSIKQQLSSLVKSVAELTTDFETSHSNENLAEDVLHSSVSESMVHTSSSSRSERQKRKRTKSVSFADSRGLDLEEVREFDAAENVIRRSFSSISSHYPVEASQNVPPDEKYFLLFPQPSNNYRSFMRTLWSQNVSLHLVWLNKSQVIGTVYVVNLAYEKRVAVRVTFDSWKSWREFEGLFRRRESEHIDIFDFDFPVPDGARKANFCVRYECNAAVYWDNNAGRDYCVAANARALNAANNEYGGDTNAFLS